MVSIAERDFAASSGRLPITWWPTPACTAMTLRLCATTSCNSRAMRMRSSTRRSCARSSACTTRPRV
ncbi:hypothetical protein BIV25_20205 [Streptomyces sp. MUSC 14]|nr:hypothetical protein BIV25_20205 [Streptomyces sp. MUSC 14]